MRQQTLDETGRHNKLDSHLGSSVDSETRTFSGPGVDGDVVESKEKGLPTIFKYQGTGKEVFVCGELNFLRFSFGEAPSANRLAPNSR